MPGGAKIEAELVERALPGLLVLALAQRQRLVHADRALVLAAVAKHRAEREVRFDVLDVLLDDGLELVDDGVVIARDQMCERAHVRARVARRATELAVIGHVVATDQDAGRHRAEPDEQQNQCRAHRRDCITP